MAAGFTSEYPAGADYLEARKVEMLDTFVARRHPPTYDRCDLTKRERATALALLYPIDVEKGGRWKKSAALKSAENAGFSERRL